MPTLNRNGDFLHCGLSLTKQDFKDECTPSKILQRYGANFPKRTDVPHFGDFTDVIDFTTAQNQLIKADEAFMTLPAKVRARFNNSPAKLLSFLEDPSNIPEAIFLGLVEKRSTEAKPPEQPKAVPPVTT